jgi:epoxyqueuosine reductase QueG
MSFDLDAALVKQKATELGADLVGIASAETLNAFPPDPKWPQTPDRISPYTKSAIVIAKRIPTGAFRAKASVPVQYMDNLVLREIDKCAYRVADWLQQLGHPSFITTSQETHWDYKGGSYAQLSTRHLGIEAGLGTMGLEVNILTPEFGPRIYLTAVLTEAAIEADSPIREQVCIGESCSRCLYSCPTDAVRHFGIDKRACTAEAQEYGYSTLQNFCREFVRQDRGKQREMLADREVFGFWQGIVRVVGSFGDCPRCLAVCPVGNDYHAHLADVQKVIPEKTPEKVEKAKGFKAARKNGDAVDGLDDWNVRWFGPDGYQGMVARQLQAFKKAQREKEQAAADAADGD